MCVRRRVVDGSPILNLASFVNTWMPAQADKLMAENQNKNLIGPPRYFPAKFVFILFVLDADEYPATRMSSIQRRTLQT